MEARSVTEPADGAPGESHQDRREEGGGVASRRVWQRDTPTRGPAAGPLAPLHHESSRQGDAGGQAARGGSEPRPPPQGPAKRSRASCAPAARTSRGGQQGPGGLTGSQQRTDCSSSSAAGVDPLPSGRRRPLGVKSEGKCSLFLGPRPSSPPTGPAAPSHGGRWPRGLWPVALPGALTCPPHEFQQKSK